MFHDAARQPGAPTMRDVAAAAGVSHQTVSRVLTDSPQVARGTRERVVAAIAALHYQPNETARRLGHLRGRARDQG